MCAGSGETVRIVHDDDVASPERKMVLQASVPRSARGQASPADAVILKPGVHPEPQALGGTAAPFQLLLN